MPFDTHSEPSGVSASRRPEPPEKPVTAWTTYEELSPRQRALYGPYIAAKDRSRREAEAVRKGQERAAEAMRHCGDSKARAFAMLIGEAL